MLISVDDTFSFREATWFLDRNYDECLHHIGNDHIIKALMVHEHPVLVRISAGLHIEVLKGNDDDLTQQAIQAYITEWFDLNRDLRPFYKLLSSYKSLAYMVDDFRGLRLIGIPDLFEAISWSIIGQQINLTFAYKLKRRLVEKYGDVITHEGKNYLIFPDAAILALANPDDLRGMQFSTRKAEYLISTAAAFTAGNISKELLRALPDTDTRQKALTGLRGIGIWSANYSLMKSLQEQSSVPYGDAGLLNALLQHKIITDKSDNTGIARFFGKFPGWESYVVFYLWRSLAVKPLQG